MLVWCECDLVVVWEVVGYVWFVVVVEIGWCCVCDEWVWCEGMVD